MSNSGEAISEGEHVTVLETEGVILKVFKTPLSDFLEESSSPGEDRP